MSASREKKARHEQIASGYVDPNLAKKEELRRKEKRTNLLYALVGVAFVVVAVAVLLINSAFLQKRAVAAVVGGEKYTAADMSYYYANMLNTYGSYASYMGEDYLKEGALDSLKGAVAVARQGEAASYQIDDVLAQEETATLELLDDYAAQGGFPDRGAYLQAAFGKLVDEDTFLKNLRLTTYANNYAADKYNAFAADTASLDAQYAADSAKYDSVTARYVTVDIKTTDGAAPTEEQTAAAKETAEKIYDGFKSGLSLETLAKANDCDYFDLSAISSGSSPLPMWLFDASRKVGDNALVEGITRYYVVEFLGRSKNDYHAVNVRHILLSPAASELAETDAGYAADVQRLKEEAKAKAELLLEQWETGEATEASFATLAMTNSADSSASNGGLIGNVTKGSMVKPFEDWCFDSSRQSGDSDIVETEYGYHVMYFIDTNNVPYWQQQAADTLYDDWYAEIIEAITAEQASGMKFVG